MVNLDTGTAITFVAEGSLVRYQLQEYVQDKQLVITQTALSEFINIVEQIGGVLEQGRANQLLQRLTIIADNPSIRALNLQPTRKLGQNDIIILGTGDRWGIITLTADAKAIRAAIAQGVEFDVYIHPPYPLTGN